jgi:hypothetical protein
LAAGGGVTAIHGSAPAKQQIRSEIFVYQGLRHDDVGAIKV